MAREYRYKTTLGKRLMRLSKSIDKTLSQWNFASKDAEVKYKILKSFEMMIDKLEEVYYTKIKMELEK